jgi:hypothetical protein
LRSRTTHRLQVPSEGSSCPTALLHLSPDGVTLELSSGRTRGIEAHVGITLTDHRCQGVPVLTVTYSQGCEAHAELDELAGYRNRRGIT